MTSIRQGEGGVWWALFLVVLGLLGGGLATDATAAPGDDPATNHVIVALGDSYAAGQGTDKRGRQRDEACDRSHFSGVELAARRLERESRETDVTLINVTCSGAKILEGGILDPQHPQDEFRPPQIRAAQRRLARRGYTAADVDAVVVGIGGNDIGFASTATACVKPGKPCFKRPEVASKYCAQDSPVPCAGPAHNELFNRYGQLAACLAASCAVPGAAELGTGGLGVTDSTRIVLTEYPNLTQDVNGDLCELGVRVRGRTFGMTREETRYARDQILRPLNQTGLEAAALHGWGYVGGVYDASTPHGFCAGEERWVYSIGDVYRSLTKGETDDGGYVSHDRGILHPNKLGQRNYACQIYLQLKPRLTGTPVSLCPPRIRVVEPTIPAKFTGSWHSPLPVNQPTSSKTYYVQMTLRDGRRGTQVGEIYYPGLECSGVLTLIEARRNRVTLREDITAEPVDPCVKQGTITLEPSATGLDWSYSGDSLTATAALERG